MGRKKRQSKIKLSLKEIQASVRKVWSKGKAQPHKNKKKEESRKKCRKRIQDN